MITDSQVHLWEADRPERPWAPGARAHLPEPMTAERMLGLMDETGIDRAVISPAATLPDRSPAYALEVAAKYPKRFRVMPWFLPAKHMDLLPRWLDTPGVCGLRLMLHEAAHMKLFEEGVLEPLWAACERYGIALLAFNHGGVGIMEPIAKRFPGLPLIVDHFNWVAPEDRERKMQEMESLAKYPNVHIKMSALPRQTRMPPPYDDLIPLILRIHAAYGAKRMMWGSDQTMILSTGTGTFSDNLDIIRSSVAKHVSAEDIGWMLHGTATQVLRWPVE